MERFLNYDVYEFNLSRIGGSSSCNLKSLLIGITSWSLILVVSSRTSTVLNFMDGIVSYCGKERVMVFTMTAGSGDASESGRGGWFCTCTSRCAISPFVELVQEERW
ncbi:hypothetical protein QJS04_geneDACA024100 [Acorus gramineus]|uniref:Uncharacterized protein n=1 Tax=Acorus gramineus TaxID=55184 RepID=A0AAV9ANL8_ACOGR|nr:hypothetical protein QJS04_geneDACA024100 [Acorus gramineus]